MNLINYKKIIKNFPRLILLLIIISSITIGTVGIINKWSNEKRIAKINVMHLTETAETSIIEFNVMKLISNPQDFGSFEYSEVEKSLSSISNINNEINFAYIFIQDNDKLSLIADSTPDNFIDLNVRQKYWELDDEFYPLLQSGQTFVSEPFTYQGSSLISVLVPIKVARENEIIAIFCADYPTEFVLNGSINHTVTTAISVMLFIMIIIICCIVFSKNRMLHSEKKKLIDLDNELNETLEVFKTVFNQSPIGLSINHNSKYIMVEDSDEISVNPMFEKIMSRSKEELKNMQWTDITYPDDLPQDLKNMEKLMAGEINGYDMDKRFIRPDGSLVWTHMIITPLKLNDNKKYSYLCLLEDITSRKNIEKALHESQREKAVLLDNLPGMAYRCNYDKEWTMIFVSQGCYELTGYNPESILNNKEKSFSDIIHSKYRDYLWEKWHYVLQQKAKLSEEYQIITASGEIKWVFEQGQGIFDEAGNVIALEGLIIDITDRKNREIEIEYLGNHDVLTGLHNRRYFFEEMNKLDDNTCLPLSVIIGDINGVRLINNAFGDPEGDCIIKETANIIKSFARESDIIARTGGDDFSILLPKTDNETAIRIMQNIKDACENYKQNNQEKPYNINISLGSSTKESVDKNILSVYKAAEDYMYKRKLLDRKSSHANIMSAIMATMLAKSQETEEHAQRISQLSMMIGVQMNLPQRSLDLLELFSMLHDIGKIGTDDGILNKPGKLNEEEWKVMKKHPGIGYKIAISSPELEPIADYIYTHHERYDGTGYPQGLKGKDIPLLSRILAVADAYDAMTETRIYRKGVSKEAAIAEINKCSGTQFDPHVVEIFNKLMK